MKKFSDTFLVAMKNLFLSAAMMSVFAGMAFASSETASSSQPTGNVPELNVDKFLSASSNMQKAINEDDPVLEKLNLDADDLEIMMPDEQFQAVCDAISSHYAEIEVGAANKAKLEDAKVIFGAENAKEIQPFIGNQAAIDNARRQLRDAYNVFADYHSTQELASSVVDWHWGDSWGVTINPSVGTLGVGIDAGYEFNRFFKIRAHYGTGRLDTTMKLSDADADVTWENQDNYGVFVDWHPKGSQFHVTAGLMRMDPRIRIDAKYTATSGLKDMNPQAALIPGYHDSYRVSAHYTMDGDWENEIQPYVGVGWSSDGSKKRTLYFSIDIGLAYLGEGNYTRNNQNIAGGNPHLQKWNGTEWAELDPTDSDYQHDLNAAASLVKLDNNIRDAVNKVADFLNDMYVYPVIQIGGGIRF